MHKEIVITDTSCLIILEKIEHLTILKQLFNKIYITPEIASEYSQELPAWIITEKSDTKLYQSLSEIVDSGEASAMALAMKKENVLLILDDSKARKLAKQLELNYTGTLGIIVKAAKQGILENVETILKMIQETNFHITDQLIQSILEEIDKSSNNL